MIIIIIIIIIIIFCRRQHNDDIVHSRYDGGQLVRVRAGPDHTLRDRLPVQLGGRVPQVTGYHHAQQYRGVQQEHFDGQRHIIVLVVALAAAADDRLAPQHTYPAAYA